jgi:hypothetical protein
MRLSLIDKAKVGLMSLAGLLLATVIPAHGFSNSSLHGSYIVKANTYDFNGLGVYSFDGRGNVSGSQEIASSVCQVSGSYGVNSDGSGSMSLAPTCPFEISGWNFEIANPSASEVYAFATEVDTPIIVGVSAIFSRRRIAKAQFTAATLSGPYAFLISGISGNDGRIAGLGTLTSDGQGNATVTLSFDTADAVCNGTTTGIYTVNPDGSGTLNLPVIWVAPNCVFTFVNPPTLTPWNFFFDDSAGTHVDMIVADGNENVVGRLSRQSR